MAKHNLANDELSLGRYKVQRVYWEHGEWSQAGYWVNAMVTNRRLIFYPTQSETTQNRKSLKAADISSAWNVCLGGRDGLLIVLKDGRELYMLVEWSQGNRLARDVNQMLLPPVQPRITPRLVVT